MTQQTLSIIEKAFNDALVSPHSLSLMDVLENFRGELNANAHNVPKEDRYSFYLFIDGINACYYYRWKQGEYGHFIKNAAICLGYIFAWVNDIQNLDFAIDITARLKSLISDLKKILLKAIEQPQQSLRTTTSIDDLSSTVRDRLGVRMVIHNEDSEILYHMLEVINNIIGGQNPETKEQFIDWYSIQDMPPSHKRAIKEILDTPFAISHFKNYVLNPKPNGYRTVQFTCTVQPYSSTVPGLQFEIQFRTKEMNEVAIFGSASHETYKSGKNENIDTVICVNDPVATLRFKNGLDKYVPLIHCQVKGSKISFIE